MVGGQDFSDRLSNKKIKTEFGGDIVLLQEKKHVALTHLPIITSAFAS